MKLIVLTLELYSVELVDIVKVTHLRFDMVDWKLRASERTAKSGAVARIVRERERAGTVPGWLGLTACLTGIRGCYYNTPLTGMHYAIPMLALALACKTRPCI